MIAKTQNNLKILFVKIIQYCYLILYSQMENTFTRISDLPNGNSQPQAPAPGSDNLPNGNSNELPNNYIPINVHPNPYGISEKNPIIDMPQDTTSVNNPKENPHSMPVSNQLSEQDIAELRALQQQRLPSRDIQQDTTHYSQDEATQPNYIPKHKDLDDYVRDHEKSTEKNLREYEEKKRRMNTIDNIITDFQTPIFIAILYFIFQMPMVNTFIFKRFSFLSIYNDDGNFNFYGLLLKSMAFGSLYYTVIKFTTYISEI